MGLSNYGRSQTGLVGCLPGASNIKVRVKKDKNEKKVGIVNRDVREQQ